MKTIKIIFIGLLIALQSCDSFLEEDNYSQLAPENFLTTGQGVESVLFSSYQYTNDMVTFYENDLIALSAFCTDLFKQEGGGEFNRANPIMEFNWDPGHGYLNRPYNRSYMAIRDANIVIENIDRVQDLSPEEKLLLESEARFLRAYNYYKLWDLYGPTPIRRSTTDPISMAKATEKELFDYIESELLDVVDKLPKPGEEKMYGRANKGNALGLLTKFYLNSKQWDKCVSSSQSLIDLNYYELFADIENLFTVENEINREFILVKPADANNVDTGNNFLIVSAPRGLKYEPTSGLTWQSNWRAAASNYQAYDEFYNSFDPNDKRLKFFVTHYINDNDATVQLLGNDASMIWKYRPDPNANVNEHGNDKSVIRYADILLSRAEALNEVNGPNQAAIDLINQVRNRAGLDDLELSDYGTKIALRDQILKERGWELFYEEQRRRDLIRHGKFIEFAHQRGISNAQPYHERYPIPQEAMDPNELLKQNEGY